MGASASLDETAVTSDQARRAAERIVDVSATSPDGAATARQPRPIVQPVTDLRQAHG
jgi:hypothetical protein